jgi:hypothetical protein
MKNNSYLLNDFLERFEKADLSHMSTLDTAFILPKLDTKIPEVVLVDKEDHIEPSITVQRGIIFRHGSMVEPMSDEEMIDNVLTYLNIDKQEYEEYLAKTYN